MKIGALLLCPALALAGDPWQWIRQGRASLQDGNWPAAERFLRTGEQEALRQYDLSARWAARSAQIDLALVLENRSLAQKLLTPEIELAAVAEDSASFWLSHSRVSEALHERTVAQQSAATATAIARRANQPLLLAACLGQLARTDPHNANASLREATKLARKSPSARAQIAARSAWVALETGDSSAAKSFAQDALRQYQELHHLPGILHALHLVARAGSPDITTNRAQWLALARTSEAARLTIPALRGWLQAAQLTPDSTASWQRHAQSLLQSAQWTPADLPPDLAKQVLASKLQHAE